MAPSSAARAIVELLREQGSLTSPENASALGQMFSDGGGNAPERIAYLQGRVDALVADAGLEDALAELRAKAGFPPLKPACVRLPSIAGVARLGEVLTVADVGGWEHGPDQHGFRWERGPVDADVWIRVTGGGQRDYPPQSADLGHRLRVVVVAANASENAEAASAPVGPVENAA